jgi:hypothetical protein
LRIQYHKFPTLHCWFELVKDPFFFFESMTSHMATFYEPQVTQVNEKSTPESSLNLTFTQHPRDEEPELWEVHARFEIDPPRA